MPSKQEVKRIKQEHKEQAKQCRRQYRTLEKLPISSSCYQLGVAYGTGIGLYFQIMIWIRNAFFVAALATLPFLVIINTSKFTDYQHRQTTTFGFKMYSKFSINSLSFASILEDAMDDGKLNYLTISIANRHSVLSKDAFLTLISVMDTGGTIFFFSTCVLLGYLAKKFVNKLDEAMVEVADYTVVVKGLGETNAAEIGDYFSRFGKVMDVVIVKDFGPLLEHCKEATDLERQRRVADSHLAQHNAAAYQRRLIKAQKRMQKFMAKVEKQMDMEEFAFKAAFVTFNTEEERATCQKNCPSRWFSSLFMRKRNRFPGGHRFWVEQAMPPEDYIYENLHYNRPSRMMRQLLVGAVVLGTLVICACAVTFLKGFDFKTQREIYWNDQLMDNDLQSWSRANATATCTPELMATCTADLNAYSWMGDGMVNLTLHEPMTWTNNLEKFLKESKVLKEMNKCSSTTGVLDCSSTMFPCLPCYCYGLMEEYKKEDQSAEWLQLTKKHCTKYVDGFIATQIGVRFAVSVTVVLLNVTLRKGLESLVRVEKHWTRSAEEAAFALYSYVAQLLNSVVVLVLVNAKAEGASAAFNQLVDSAGQWFKDIILSGLYQDFTPGWYEDVGFSLTIIMIIQALIQPGLSFAWWCYRHLTRWCLLNCAPTASQEKYNAVYLGEDFILANGVSDMMLNITIAMMFGSGLPLLTIIAFLLFVIRNISERHYLTTQCRNPHRYSEKLPMLVADFLQLTVALHCAFGLWMHTYFKTPSVGSMIAEDAPLNKEDFSWLHDSTGRWARVTQWNGLPLFLLLVMVLGWILFIKTLAWGLFARTMEMLCNCSLCWFLFDEDTDNGVPYDLALQGVANKKLSGAPTYRMPHHPVYADAFKNPLYKPIWFKAFGHTRYTRLMSKKGGFIITQEPILEDDGSDLEVVLKQLPPEVQRIARKMATSEGGAGRSPRTSSTSIPADEIPGAMAEVTIKPRVVKETEGIGSHSGNMSPVPMSRLSACSARDSPRHQPEIQVEEVLLEEACEQDPVCLWASALGHDVNRSRGPSSAGQGRNPVEGYPCITTVTMFAGVNPNETPPSQSLPVVTSAPHRELKSGAGLDAPGPGHLYPAIAHSPSQLGGGPHRQAMLRNEAYGAECSYPVVNGGHKTCDEEAGVGVGLGYESTPGEGTRATPSIHSSASNTASVEQAWRCVSARPATYPIPLMVEHGSSPGAEVAANCCQTASVEEDFHEAACSKKYDRNGLGNDCHPEVSDMVSGGSLVHEVAGCPRGYLDSGGDPSQEPSPSHGTVVATMQSNVVDAAQEGPQPAPASSAFVSVSMSPPACLTGREGRLKNELEAVSQYGVQDQETGDLIQALDKILDLDELSE